MQHHQNLVSVNDSLKISVCMIVKDEAKHLENSLRVLTQYFDDIVVVDTGSSDDSKKIASQFTDKIDDFVWISDFSAARNYSLSLAKYDWVLVIDADEELVFIDYDELINLIETYPGGIGSVEIINHIDEQDGESTIRERVSRLFRKNLYEYQGIIHEQISARRVSATPAARFSAPLSLKHSGYKKDVLVAKDKITRNINLLTSALKNTPQDPYLHYQLGKSYYLARDYLSAADSFSAALGYQTDFSYEYNAPLIESYGYSLINTGRYQQALDVLHYEKYCHSTDFTFLKALIFMNNGNFQQAVDTFLLCTQMPPGRSDGINDYKANYNIGVILECSGMPQQAMEFYNKCGNYNPAVEGTKRICSEH